MFNFYRIPLHFRHNNSTHHYSVIGGENNKQYAYMTLTHSAYSGHKKNIRLSINPNSADKKDAYLVKRIFIDNKNKFSSVLPYLQINSKDQKEISDWFNKNKLFRT